MHFEALDQEKQGGPSPSLDISPNISTGTAQKNAKKLRNSEKRVGPSIAQPGAEKSNRVGGLNAWQRDGWGEDGARCGGACAVKDEECERVVVPLLCGQWGCEVCGRLRYGWFWGNVKKASEDHALQYFWTLTIDHKGVSAADSWELISRAWNRFRTAVVREFGPLSYIWVVEPQRSGHAHLHVLWDRYLSHKKVSALWKSATEGSYIVYVERVTSSDVGRYMAKYVGKLAGQVLTVPGMGELSNKHRFGKSQNIHFSSFRVGAPGWAYLAESYKGYRRWAGRQGRILEEQTGWVPSMRIRIFSREVWERVRGLGGDVELWEGQVLRE